MKEKRLRSCNVELYNKLTHHNVLFLISKAKYHKLFSIIKMIKIHRQVTRFVTTINFNIEVNVNKLKIRSL